MKKWHYCKAFFISPEECHLTFKLDSAALKKSEEATYMMILLSQEPQQMKIYIIMD